MRLAIGIAAVLAATSVQAAECQSGKATALTLTDWAATMKEGSIGPYPSVTIKFRNDSPKEIRMVKASVWFIDALGETISGVELDKDIRLKPEAEAEQVFAMTGSVDFERLTTLEKRDASGRICVQAAVYEDGTKEEFK
jgi:hypothetical protein